MLNINNTLNSIIDNAERECEFCSDDCNTCHEDNIECPIRNIIELALDAKDKINTMAYCHR